MQINSSYDAIPSFEPVVRSVPNSGPTATNVADAGPPVTETPDDTSGRRERFGDAQLRRIDAGDLRGLRDLGKDLRFGRSIVQRARRDVDHALRDGAKDLLKDVKKELRSVLREVGDDKDTRKAVRDAYKDFRREVKDVVKSTRSSRQFDTTEIAEDLESAYGAFTEDLRSALEGPRTESLPYEPTSLNPGHGTSVVPPTPTKPGETAGTQAVAPENEAKEEGLTQAVDARPPASVADEIDPEPRPRPRFADLFNRLDTTFKDGLNDIVSGISDALERAHEAFDRFRERESGGHHGRGGRGRFVDRAA